MRHKSKQMPADTTDFTSRERGGGGRNKNRVWLLYDVVYQQVPRQIACELVSGDVPTLCLASGIVTQSDFVGSTLYAYLGVTCHLHC